MDMVHKDIDVLLGHLKSDGVDKELKSELMYMRTIFKFQNFIFSGYLGDTITEKIFEEGLFYSPSCRTSKECMVNYVDSLVSLKGRQATGDASLLKDLQSIKKATRRCLSNSTLVPSEVLEEKLRVLMDSLHFKASTAQQEDLLTRIQALADSAADLCFSFWVKMSDHFLDTYEISHLLYLRNICKERVPPLEIKEASQMVLIDVCKRLELVKGLLMNLPKQYLKQDKIKHLLRQIAALTSKTRYHSPEQDMAVRVKDELLILLENSKEICLDVRKLLHSGFPLTDDWGMIDSLVMSLNERLNLKADLVNKHEVEKVIAVVKQGRKFGSLDKLRERIFKTAYEADYVIDSMNLDNDPPPYLESYLSDIIMEATIIHDEIFDIGFLNVVKSGEAVESSNPLSSLVNTPSDDNVLGFKEEEAIKEQLLSGLRKLDVITIVGVSGLGKTTLANKIYNDQNVINHFQVRAWCCVSQEYNKTKLLCEIYSQVTEDELTEEMQRLIKENREAKVTEVDLAEKFSKCVMDKNTRSKVTETDVAEKLHNFLKEKKYLIVLDDIWESRACDEIIRCFPTEENGSRIMLTTRFDEVAHEIKLHSDPHYLPLFTTEESWELLQWKLLQNERCYPELLEIGKEISQSCRGLPLFIVLVAGLLSSIKKEERLWSEVAETLSSVASEHKMHMHILGLVYKHLPDHLKSCLLFFAAFPEDQEIAVSKLIQLWAAEGFVGKIERKSLEDAAEDYLNNLHSAGLIIVSKRRYDGSIISCRVHNTIHEFCSEKAKKERFLMIPNTNNQIPMWDLACLRICFNHQDIECHNPFFSWLQWSPSVRTILCTSRRRDPHLSKAIDFSQISHMSRLIRVLDLESITVGNTFFSVIERLPHLRFIAVHTGYFNFVFPSSLGDLQNLETLKIKTENQCMVLPKTISNMVKLRQLDITDSFQFGIDEDDSCLKNIQALSTVVLSNKQSIDVMTRFPLLQRLKCIYIGSNESSPESYEFLELEKIYQLEYLHISYDGSLERRDLIDFKFPWSLKKLILNGFSLPAYEICKVALIPTLVALKLQNVHFKDHQWDVEEYDFPKLNYLKLHNCSIVYWSALTSCFPCLKRLILSRCIILKEVPSCFGNIATLEGVEVYRCNSSLEDSVLKIQSEATNRSSPLMVRILKSENLQILYSLNPKKSSDGVSRLPENVVHKTKDMEPAIVSGSGTETGQLIVAPVSGRKGEKNQVFSYMAEGVVATGSFAVVFQAKCLETGETVAIKKVLQDRRYKNRELQIMRMLEHPNVVQLRHCFYSTTESNEVYLNLVLEYVPETVYRVSRHYSKMNQHMPLIYVQLYTYQICRALNYIHNVFGVCHRDIKPQNLLVNPHTHQLKICDFGSAKMLVPGEPNISYICSRFYRAPELIFGATEYTTKIDVWSVGCVMAELLLGHPLFSGESSVDQLVEIVKILGTPTMEEIKCMNPNYTEFKLPQIKARSWHKVFNKRMPPEAVDLVSRLLQYSPSLRFTALEACAHPFFDALRDPNACLPNGRPLPPLFNFTPQELSGAPAELRNRLIPERTRK